MDKKKADEKLNTIVKLVQQIKDELDSLNGSTREQRLAVLNAMQSLHRWETDSLIRIQVEFE